MIQIRMRCLASMSNYNLKVQRFNLSSMENRKYFKNRWILWHIMILLHQINSTSSRSDGLYYATMLILFKTHIPAPFHVTPSSSLTAARFRNLVSTTEKLGGVWAARSGIFSKQIGFGCVTKLPAATPTHTHTHYGRYMCVVLPAPPQVSGTREGILIKRAVRGCTVVVLNEGEDYTHRCGFCEKLLLRI